ncbi:MAG: CsbD family protein [Gemmatimonas sp.]|nr:CsbD family protein [Gemmatimonas sp.]
MSSAVEAETIMNAQTIEGNWTQFKGKIREQWGKLTDDDVDIIAGKREQLIGKIKERYGKSTDVVSREIKEFEARHQKTE